MLSDKFKLFLTDLNQQVKSFSTKIDSLSDGIEKFRALPEFDQELAENLDRIKSEAELIQKDLGERIEVSQAQLIFECNGLDPIGVFELTSEYNELNKETRELTDSSITRFNSLSFVSNQRFYGSHHRMRSYNNFCSNSYPCLYFNRS